MSAPGGNPLGWGAEEYARGQSDERDRIRHWLIAEQASLGSELHAAKQYSDWLQCARLAAQLRIIARMIEQLFPRVES